MVTVHSTATVQRDKLEPQPLQPENFSSVMPFKGQPVPIIQVET